MISRPSCTVTDLACDLCKLHLLFVHRFLICEMGITPTYLPTQLGQCEGYIMLLIHWAEQSSFTAALVLEGNLLSVEAESHIPIKKHGWGICFLVYDEHKPHSVLKLLVPLLLCSESPSYGKILLTKSSEKTAVCIWQREEMQETQGRSLNVSAVLFYFALFFSFSK